MRKSACFVLLALAGASIAGASVARADQLWSVHGGTSVLVLDSGVLTQLGLRVASTDPANFPAPEGQVILPVSFEDEQFYLTGNGTSRPHFTSGTVHNRGGIVISGPRGEVTIYDLALGAAPGAIEQGVGNGELATATSVTSFDATTATLTLGSDEVVISRQLAASLGVPAAAGVSIGRIQASVDMAYAGGDTLPSEGEDGPVPHVCSNPTTGPDVIVGDLQSISSWTSVGGIDAFSVGTTSCNIGNVPLLWQASNPNHPVIPQHMYRMKTVEGSVRFEQIGMSWMKHGFTALSQNLCCPCTGPGGSQLGIGCSDPYTSGRNGTQVVGPTSNGGCGPRFQTNPHTGAFTYPYMFKSIGTISGTSDPNTISRRLQVPIADVNTALNVGASYFIEAHYVSPDDAAARNQNNNVSYRPCTISGTTETSATASGVTVRQKAAIQAWKAVDPTVTETLIDTPEDKTVVDFPGRGILSAKATDLGGGMWHYEYALYNMNSDRGFSSFAVPTNPAAAVSNIGFHDVNFHSGDGHGTAQGALVNVDGTDWPGSFSAGNVSWACIPLTPPANVLNTNYLHWGTTYNFRFDCNQPPTTGNITIGMFKAVVGEPDSITVNTVVPLPVCDAPAIDAIAAQNASCGSPFTSSTPTVAGTGPFNWTIASGGQPGMTIAPTTGVISWPSPVPSATPYDVTLQAASTCSAAVDTEVMSISVPFAADPQIDLIDPQNAACGAPFTSDAPTGANLAGATWSITLGGQPGMTINASGVISWPSPVPSANPYQVTIQATNACASAASDTEVVSISVPFGPTATINPMSATSTICGIPFASSFPVANGGTPPYAWSLVGAPTGMTINAGTGQIEWPNPVVAPAPYSVTIQVTDGCADGFGSTPFELTVKLGDFDGDGLVNVNDVPYFIDHLIGNDTSSPCAGDMNGDTFLDGLDIQGWVSQL